MEVRRWIWALVLAGLLVAYWHREEQRRVRLARVDMALNVALEEEDWRSCVEYALIQLRRLEYGNTNVL